MLAQSIAFQEALNWLESSERFGMKLDLENISGLLKAIGNPHKNLKVIHVTGTNGKGSTSAMIASVLREAGYTTGLYTSPHLVSPRERIQKNGEWIPEDRFIDGIRRMKGLQISRKPRPPASGEISPKADRLLAGPTYFEIMTALTLKYFFDESVDFVVLETGLGGRLDSTNIVDSKIQVITNVELEHTRYLGNTLSEIAWEKAGIIKPASSVITGARGEALKVIEDRSASLGSRLSRLDHELKAELRFKDLSGQRIVVYTGKDHYDIHLRLLGHHQMENCALAVGAIEALIVLGYSIQKGVILEGLEKARWPGRFEVLRQEPLVILDAAHNPAGARALARTWRDYFGTRKADLVFSVLEDKDVRSMAAELSGVVETVTLVEISHSRGLERSSLEEIWAAYLPKNKVLLSTVEEVLSSFQGQTQRERPILITGSIYLLGEILSGLRNADCGLRNGDINQCAAAPNIFS